jgi:phage shock protein C
MQSPQPSLFARSDTLFGVCQALGEDLGFNPLYLRISLGVLLLWNPTIVLGAYVAMGVVVAISRLAFPRPRAAHVANETIEGEVVTMQPASEREPLKADNSADERVLAIAA